MQCPRALVVLTLVLSSLGAAAGQIISMKTVEGKQISCIHSGLMSDLKDCGVPDWYEFAFVGSISAITPVQADEKELQVIPEEVFHGNPTIPFTVLTAQAACLPKLAVGDRWLFFLRNEKGKPIVLDYYGNDSRPVADAQEQIETLRRLKNIGDSSILRGQVKQGRPFQGKAVPNAHVVAGRESDKLQFGATTTTDGRYEFQPLPPGEYRISVDPIGSFQPDDSAIDLKPAACWDLTLSRSPHAQLGGHVRHSDGTAVPGVDVVLIKSDNTWYSTDQTDANGHFTFDSQEQGEYVVGLNYPARSDWFNGGGGGFGLKLPPASLFYFNATERSGARVIRLATDEKLDNLDFIVPVQ
jgi:hypothetical protein